MRYEQLAYDRSQKNKDLVSSLSDGKAHEDEMQRIQAKLKENTKVLCRNLKETPNESNNWKKVQKERLELSSLLNSCIRELMSYITGQQSGSHAKKNLSDVGSDSMLLQT